MRLWCFILEKSGLWSVWVVERLTQSYQMMIVLIKKSSTVLFSSLSSTVSTDISHHLSSWPPPLSHVSHLDSTPVFGFILLTVNEIRVFFESVVRPDSVNRSQETHLYIKYFWVGWENILLNIYEDQVVSWQAVSPSQTGFHQTRVCQLCNLIDTLRPDHKW